MKRVQIRYFKPDPPNTKRVARPSRWGNPYKVGDYTLEESLRLYRIALENTLDDNPTFLNPLKGFNLGCYCKEGAPCHGDILLEFLEEMS
jgi:hypothetical protein